MRLVDRVRILVDHIRMETDALDSLPRGHLPREKAVHASADEEGILVLHVQAGQYGEIAPRPVIHMSIVTIPAALSMRSTE